MKPPVTTKGGGEATELVEILHTFLSQRSDVKVPDNYKTYWLSDFKTALLDYSYDEVRPAVIYSQLPRNQKYYIVLLESLKNLDKLVEQSSGSEMDSALNVLWLQAVQGKLPPKYEPKQKGPPQGAYRGVKAAMDAQEKKQAFEIVEDLS